MTALCGLPETMVMPLGCGPAVLFTCTIKGAAKLVLMTALCGLPETMVMPLGCGPVGVTVRVKVWENPPALAVTVAVPVALPAVTVTCACPLLLVAAVFADRMPGPEMENCTG